ncbi:MAG: DNA repair protein RecN [Candidatus Omnitrophica bacterium]|nr:DNA repair protein RecN [Candidatus Omnitrophota bacterium]
MLTHLTIKNFGLINQLTLEFDDHLNVLTGETGAGKSIVIGALRVALGDRISTSQIRDPENPCIIEAAFFLNDELRQLSIFQELCPEDDPNIIIQRVSRTNGRNSIKVNGQMITVSQLKEIGNHLMDFHGPHDHQMLLATESHIQMLDRLVDFGSIRNEYDKGYNEYTKIRQQLNELRDLSSSRDREIDLLSHQVKELEQVSLQDEEYQSLKEQQTKLTNAERLFECTNQLQEFLENSENSTSELLRKAFGPMKTLNQTDESTEPLMDLLTQCQDLNEQLINEVNDYADGLSFEPARAEEIHQQCDIYDDILRKYGPTLDDARSFYQSAKEKFDLLNDLEHNDAELKKQLAAKEKELTALAQKMSKLRKEQAFLLKKTIEKELSELGIANVQFEVRFEKSSLVRPAGYDNITFFISPNAGEDLKPLSEIVSSGEAARLMLALKKALIKVDPIPVLIFDEIDAQIGGRLGTVTGQKLRELSKIRQVIVITHLPQIASFANLHMKVTKSVKDKRTITDVRILDQKERVQELAEMMSGQTESAIAVKHATDMLKLAASS